MCRIRIQILQLKYSLIDILLFRSTHEVNFLILVSMFSMNTFSIESLKYDVLEKNGNIEIRKYQKHITASVTFTDKEEFDRSAFRTLADYIFGNNISMTSPVLTEGEKIAMTAPVLSDNGQTSWTMSFSMPSKYTLETLPTPNNPKVTIKAVGKNHGRDSL